MRLEVCEYLYYTQENAVRRLVTMIAKGKSEKVSRYLFPSVVKCVVSKNPDMPSSSCDSTNYCYYSYDYGWYDDTEAANLIRRQRIFDIKIGLRSTTSHSWWVSGEPNLCLEFTQMLYISSQKTIKQNSWSKTLQPLMKLEENYLERELYEKAPRRHCSWYKTKRLTWMGSRILRFFYLTLVPLLSLVSAAWLVKSMPWSGE